MENLDDGFSTDPTHTIWRDGKITLDVVLRRTGAGSPAELLEKATAEHVSPMNLDAVAKLVDTGEIGG
jgi:hypothetical protein